MSDALRIDIDALRNDIVALGEFGRAPDGSRRGGVTRVAFSPADIEARRHVLLLLREAGLSPRIDAAGNILARREGLEPGAPAILCGSHLDSVPNGGMFDGVLGVVAAIEMVRRLDRARMATRHPLEIVVWANEEGVAFGRGTWGSRAAAGALTDDELDDEWCGLRKAEAVARIGGCLPRIIDARMRPGSIRCYLELHIEQGSQLESAAAVIGVVDGIVGIRRCSAHVWGAAENAGTAPMMTRQDALVAAAQLVLAVRDVATSEPGSQVGTVGELNVHPNAPNVVPGEVRLTLEFRDLSEGTIRRLTDAIGRRAASIARATRTTIQIAPLGHQPPVLLSRAVQSAIERAAESSGLRVLRVTSRAGHDAQILGTIAPAGMIFVPSLGGISHSPSESTRWEDCAAGAEVLLDTVLLVDERPPEA